MRFIKSFPPSENEPNGVFRYICKETNKELFKRVYLSGYPNPNGTGEYETSLIAGINYDLNLRYCSKDGYTEYGIHLSDMYVKMTHYSLYFKQSYQFMKEWTLVDNTNGRNKTISEESIVDECGTESNCKINAYKVVNISSYTQPVTDLIIRMIGTRSDGKMFLEFTNFDIYGSLYDGVIQRKCTCQQANLKYNMNFFTIFIISLF